MKIIFCVGNVYFRVQDGRIVSIYIPHWAKGTDGYITLYDGQPLFSPRRSAPSFIKHLSEKPALATVLHNNVEYSVQSTLVTFSEKIISTLKDVATRMFKSYSCFITLTDLQDHLRDVPADNLFLEEELVTLPSYRKLIENDAKKKALRQQRIAAILAKLETIDTPEKCQSSYKSGTSCLICKKLGGTVPLCYICLTHNLKQTEEYITGDGFKKHGLLLVHENSFKTNVEYHIQIMKSVSDRFA